MFGQAWLAYFEGNTRRDCSPAVTLREEVPEVLRTPLSISLGRFQLGESAGGRIHEDVVHDRDPALDDGSRRAVQLYIEEEWRHARELALIVKALGGSLQTAHWTNGAFTACRRLLGLRTKMMTLAVAEVIGIVYYRSLAAGIGSPALAGALTRIANEESRHLDFQAEFFERAIAAAPRWSQPLYRAALRGLLLGILSAALTVLVLDHRHVLRACGARPKHLVRAARCELSRRGFLNAPVTPTALVTPTAPVTPTALVTPTAPVTLAPAPRAIPAAPADQRMLRAT